MRRAIFCLLFAALGPSAALAQALPAQPQGYSGQGFKNVPGFKQLEEAPMSPLQVQRDEFERAIAKNDAAKVRQLVGEGMAIDFNFNFERQGRTSDSPLTTAVKRGHLEIVRILLDAGADIHRKDGWGDYAITAARTAEMARFLVSRGADPNAQGMYQMTPAAKAVESGNLELLDALLAIGAKLDGGAKPTDLLARVVELNKPQLIAPLLKRGLNPRSPPTRALFLLVDKGDVESFKLILQSGADPNAGDGRDRLLLRALFRKQWAMSEALLDAGASLKIADAPGCERSIACESIQAVRHATFDAAMLAKLKARGADLDAVSAAGHTALTSIVVEQPLALQVVGGGTMAAVAVGPGGQQVVTRQEAPVQEQFIPAPDNVARIKVLLGAGANPNAKFRAFTPLMLAATMHGKPPAMVDALVAAGARIDFDGKVEEGSPDESFGPAVALPPGGGSFALMGPQGTPRDFTSGNYQGVRKGMRVGPLGWAVLAGRSDVALRLLQRDRRVEGADRNLLYFAASMGEWDLVLTALRETKEVNAANRAGVTPLMLAADAGRADVVRALLAAGADVNARSDRVWPPLTERSIGGELANLAGGFAGHGPRPPKLVGGYTALRAARERGHGEAVRALQEAGGRE